MLAISRVCGRAAHPSSLGNLYTGRSKIALSSLSQPFLSHNTRRRSILHPRDPMGADTSSLLEGPSLPWNPLPWLWLQVLQTCQASHCLSAAAQNWMCHLNFPFRIPPMRPGLWETPVPWRMMTLMGLNSLCWTVFGGAAGRQEMEGGKRHQVTCRF